jgi:hypothetical protein
MPVKKGDINNNSAGTNSKISGSHMLSADNKNGNDLINGVRDSHTFGGGD